MILKKIDERRVLMVPGNLNTTVTFCATYLIKIAKKYIKNKGSFSIALSGGTTPLMVYKKLKSSGLDWNKIKIFWSDDRVVALNDANSNYFQAMEAGFKNFTNKKNVFPMNIKKTAKLSAKAYEKLLQKEHIDMILLGLGEDGHTASLFAHSTALSNTKNLVVANYIAKLKSWRITFTIPYINSCPNILFYVFGTKKAEILKKVLSSKRKYPASHIGTNKHKAYFIADDKAASKQLNFNKLSN
jgi:6-phosphogluconolactonase